ncbi:CtsR family transcriptional regulator [Helcococcus kunzii]|uniref:CtsR family transcriptional regulator n=1 Tax=Helcococcus kunzii TaxID=40091 RepID=UPI001BB0B6A4|nr:CtsR family transcriptional regulator [Helcococcus kunzii]QUY64145.1 CtsR family transcriptional regulator [Helcococcus kunzii]
MGLTNDIENFLLNRIKLTEKQYIEIGRNELAEQFQCAPSQINYVLSTRFTPYKGYYVESRRGGRGYIKIVKLEMTEDQLINKILSETIENKITLDKAMHIVNGLREEEVITKREKLLIQHSIDDNALKYIDINDRSIIRASILKNILLALVRD